MSKEICCFAGHSQINNVAKVREMVREKVLSVIKEGVSEFWVSRYGDFDAITSSVVRELKKDYKNIEHNMVIPYLTKSINENKEEYYEKYNYIIMADMPANTPQKYRIIKSNQFMVDNCTHLICYVKYTWGGAYKTLEYAKKKKHIIIHNLADEVDFYD